MLVWSAQVMRKGWVVGDADDVLCHVFFFRQFRVVLHVLIECSVLYI